MVRTFEGVPVFPEYEINESVGADTSTVMFRTNVRIQDSEGAYYFSKVLRKEIIHYLNTEDRIRHILNVQKIFICDCWEQFMFGNADKQVYTSDNVPIFKRDPIQTPPKSRYEELMEQRT